MINTSNAYKKAIRGNREFCAADEITFWDSTRLSLETGDFVSYSINEATSSSGKFEVGAAVIKEYSVVLNNMDGKFDGYDFEGADILARVGLKLADSTWEILQKGRYRVVSAKAAELTIQVKAYDSMLFFDRPYSESSLSYPATLLQIIQDACRDCGMTYDAGTIEMGSYVVQTRPDDGALTYRDIISYCAQIMGCYARIDHMDRLSFGWYALDSIPEGLDGGNFEGASIPYENGDVADGGDFNDYSSGYAYDSGTFLDAEKYHHFYNLSTQSINTDDITITGVMASAKEEKDDKESYLYGTDEYALVLSDNPLIQKGKAQTVAGHAGGKLAGSTFRPLNITVQSDPSVEAGDIAIVTDRKQRSYATVITNTTFTMGGLQKVECSAETPTEKNYTKYGAVTKLLAKANEQAGQKLSAYDIAVKQMNQLAANTMGFYSTVITQPDGSVLAYRHDKPKLAESKTVYKSGIDGFFVTQDYQGTDEATEAVGKWKAGFDAEGNAVVNILSAIGINFSWARGGELILGGGTGADGGQGGVMIVKDSAGNEIVRCDVNGITATEGTFSGKLSGATGTFSGELQAAGGTFSGNLDAASGTFKGELQAATGSFSGAIEASEGNIGGLEVTTNGFSQKVDVSDSEKTGYYIVAINKEGIAFDVHYKYLDDRVILEDTVYTKINEDSVCTQNLQADTLKLAPGALKTGGSAARAIGISSSGNIVIMP